ncbi:uncharacterized protein LOC117342362 [Pecten maximus]|uniref:uncharacterized protein LOC117342362 n=1 Tax=Pecten maximus TaxID=6579 RepID=UPI0014583A92|nr:uncharacterized protein LOC117342362 [Pecten maximus]
MACKQPLPMTCQTHNEKMDCYCEDHKFIGCNKCIITEHRRCDEVTTTKEYFEKQKSNSKLKDMDKTLEEAANGMGLMVNSFDDQVKAMQERQQVELNSIITLRNRINAHLDKKQEEITLQMNSKYKTETGKVDLSRQRCNRLKNAMLNTKEALKLAVVREDDVDTIQLFIRSQTETGASRDLIGQFCDSLTSVNIKHEIGHDLRTLNETSFLTLGKINVEMKRQSLPNGIKLVKTLSNCRAKKVRSITLDTLPGQDGNSVQNSSRKGLKVRTEMDLFKRKPRNPAEFSVQRIALLSKLLIVSFSGQTYICLFTADGQYLDQLKTRGNPSDLCIVDINTVAVSVGDHTIQVVKVQDNKLTQLYVIGTQPRIGCYGITFVNGKFMVSTRKDIYMVTREGEALKVHTLEKDCSHIVYDPLYEQAFVSISEHQRASMSEAEMDDAWIQRPQSCSVFEQDRYAEYDTYEMGAESYRAGNALCVANAYSNSHAIANSTSSRQSDGTSSKPSM